VHYALLKAGQIEVTGTSLKPQALLILSNVVSTGLLGCPIHDNGGASSWDLQNISQTSSADSSPVTTETCCNAASDV